VAVIKRAEADLAAKNAVVLNLGDLAHQGRRIRQAAQSDAQRIRLEAEAERRRLIAGAADEGRREGYDRGLAEGREQGREQGRQEARAEAAARMQTLDAAWARALEAFSASQVEWRAAARAGVLNLALDIAVRLTRRAVEIDPQAIAGPLEAALELVADTTRPIVRVHPADEDAVREALPRLAARLDAAREAVLEIDDKVTRGSCVVRTAGGGEIDADLERQIDRVVSALRPPAGIESPRPIDGSAIELDRPDDDDPDAADANAGEGGAA